MMSAFSVLEFDIRKVFPCVCDTYAQGVHSCKPHTHTHCNYDVCVCVFGCVCVCVCV